MRSKKSNYVNHNTMIHATLLNALILNVHVSYELVYFLVSIFTEVFVTCESYLHWMHRVSSSTL